MNEVLIIVAAIIFLPLSVKIVNSLQNLIMRITGASAMYYSVKSKFMWYVIVWAILVAIVSNILG